MTSVGTLDLCLTKYLVRLKVIDIFFIPPLFPVPQTKGGKRLILLLLSF